VPAPDLSPAPICEEIRTTWRPHHLVIAVLVTAAGFGAASWFASAGGEPDAQREVSELTVPKGGLAQEYYWSFKGTPEREERFEPIGPEADKCIKFEPEGVRITLPSGYPKKRVGTGLAVDLGIKGDFEITIGFEILKEPEPEQTGQGTGLFLGVDLNTETYNRATLTRGMGEAGQYTSWFQLTNAGPDKPREEKLTTFPTEAATGRLRLVRTEDVLSYQAADGTDKDFTVLDEHPFRKDDVKHVRIGGQTGGPEAALDARVVDLRIRAGSLANLPVSTASPKFESHGWLAAALVAGLVITGSCILGLWLFFRQRRDAEDGSSAPRPSEQAHPASPSGHISFPCSGCGKKLKARAELAGKKVKCPKCAKIVLVLTPEAAESNVPGM
jgi:hypothetical protein